MKNRRTLLALCAALVAGAWAPVCGAQTYPAHALHWIVTYPPGGTTDVIARLVADATAKELGEPIVVDNKPGAGGRLGMDVVAKSAPDGYTFLVSDASIATAPSLFKELTFSPEKDLRAVTLIATVPHVIVVNPALPAKTVAQLAAAGQQTGAALNFASGGQGSPLHLAGEVFRAATGIRWTHIPYKGAGPAILSVVTNEAQVATPSVPAVIPQIEAGKLRALAVTSAERLSVLPSVPTVAELGYPGATVSGWVGLHAPAQVPDAMVAKMQAAVAHVLQNPQLRAHLETLGASVVGSSSEQYASLVHREMTRWNAVVKSAGIKPE
jgi:tripartite-type tricarboxylate transporter receptor subunit TctC